MNVIKFGVRRAEVESNKRQLLRTVKELDEAIKTTEASLSTCGLKAFRTALNQMKNARYVLQKEINKLERGTNE